MPKPTPEKLIAQAIRMRKGGRVPMAEVAEKLGISEATISRHEAKARSAGKTSSTTSAKAPRKPASASTTTGAKKAAKPVAPPKRSTAVAYDDAPLPPPLEIIDAEIRRV